MTLTEQKRIQPGYEPIRGYVLEKRLGRGGYGEVWRAEAPGGLKKAVKFVFGHHDERRASQELKSLERIKGVQHPFILTLERFELIDNRLVIVTELAEGSLEDVYEQHKDRGSCGIPREILLGYMRDAADALDYLHQLYKLQHLDIKPGNLLMVGGRVKVADFGLLKDLGDVDCSMVGGLTPIYAPPELFDGRPSVHSDQYSLAVMYQELLTGTRPFAGRTIAQLATQHVHNAPNLEPLPPSDRPSVARALEKNPDCRFDSCSDFVRKLLLPHGHPEQLPETDGNAQPPVAEHEVENLPQLHQGANLGLVAGSSQVLVVALGGTGADFLHQIRGRVVELGSASPMTLHSVLIDTDSVTTQNARMMDPTPHVPRCHTVHAGLRTPGEYRESGKDRLRSISRRWIYNVPRNGSTGGMRPIGRLALVDHGDEVLKALRQAVADFKTRCSQSVAEESPKVYVVGSLTGGTGSGMYLDVAHLLRHLLDEAAMENVSILSLLTTNRFQGDPARPLALHTTKSAFKELAHFMKPGNSYPGDEGAHWPGVPAARTPLHNAYVIAPSPNPGSPNAIESAVNYLWADATICGELLSKGRSDESDSASSGAQVRSLGVVQIGDPDEGKASLLAPYTCKSLLLRWLGNPSDGGEDAEEFCRRVTRRCHLNAQTLCNRAQNWLGSDQQERETQLKEFVHGLTPNVLQDERVLRASLFDWLSKSFDLEQSEVLVEQIINQISNEITIRLQDGRLDLSSTILGITQLCDHARSLAEHLKASSEEEFCKLEGQAGPMKRDASGGDPSMASAAESDEGLTSRAIATGDMLALIISERVAAAIATSLETQLHELSKVYSNASVTLATTIQALNRELSWSSDPWDSMEQPLADKLPSLLDQLHLKCCEKQLLQMVRTPGSLSAESLVAEITDDASTLIRDTIGNYLSGGIGAMTIESTVDAEDPSQDMADRLAMLDAPTLASETEDFPIGETDLANGTMVFGGATQTQNWLENRPAQAMTLEAAIDAVRPPLLECGGKQRFYLLCRNKHEQDELLERFPEELRDSVTVVLTRTSVPMLIHEGQQIEIANIVVWLQSLTGDDGRISSRLMTRSDISWGN